VSEYGESRRALSDAAAALGGRVGLGGGPHGQDLDVLEQEAGGPLRVVALRQAERDDHTDAVAWGDEPGDLPGRVQGDGDRLVPLGDREQPPAGRLSPAHPAGGQELLARDDVDPGDAAAELLQGADGAGGDHPARQRGALDQAAVLGVLPAGAGGDPRPRHVHQHRLLAADGPPVGAAA
jgi:hypothetical protein